MNFSDNYFLIAREEEKDGQYEAALLHYISSLLSGFSSGRLPYQSAEKIRRLQKKLQLSDDRLLSCVYCYKQFSVSDCQKLLYFSISGNLSEIKNILSSTVIV